MGLSEPRAVFGVHSFSPFKRDDGLFYGTQKVLGGSTFNLTGELVKLMGGSNRYSWAVEGSTIEAEITLKFKSYEDWLFEVFLGKAVTVNAAEASGSASALTNKNGTSAQDATTGMASVGVKSGSEADLKFTRYVVKVVSPTTVDVYAGSDVDFARGTDKVFEDDALKITASPLTIATGAPVEVPGYGLELTGGSGAIAMVADDTATFEVRPPNSKSMDVVIGGSADVYPEFGALMLSKKRSNGEMFEVEACRCKGIGAPFGMEESAWAEGEAKATAFYDSSANRVATIRHVSPNEA